MALRVFVRALPGRQVIELGDPDLQPIQAVRCLDGVQSSQFGSATVDKTGSLSPGHDVVVRGFVADVKHRLIQPFFLAQVLNQSREKTR